MKEVLLLITGIVGIVLAMTFYVKQNKKVKGTCCKYNDITECYEQCCGYCPNNRYCDKVKCNHDPKKCGGLV